MSLDGNTLPVMGVLFLGTLVRSTLGFGEALIAVPLLAMLMPVKQAAPIAVLVSVTIAAVILLQDWQKVHFRSAGWLTISTFFGIPAGLLLLRMAPESVVKGILAVIILAFSAHSLFKRGLHRLDDDRFAWLFGFHAGILGGAYGMNGPPLAVYGALRRWQPEHFRATLQAYFLPASVAGMAGYWFAGLWTPTVNQIFASSIPAVLIAIVCGRALNRRIQPHRFENLIYLGLAATGVVLLYQSLAV